MEWNDLCSVVPRLRGNAAIFQLRTCAILDVHGSLLTLGLPDARVSVCLKWSPIRKHLFVADEHIL